MTPRRRTDRTRIATAYAAVVERIAQAASRSGRDPSAVRLIAVSKTVPVGRIRELLDLGHTLLGENRVQEAMAKIEELGDSARFHLIGHLQRNKARHAVGRFETIHGVDSLPLATEIDRRASAAGIRQPILLQANLSGEPTKSGVPEDELPELVASVAGLQHVELGGLMTIPPPADDPESSRVWFVRLREARDRLADRFGLPLAELSMGMTDDFEVAVEEGATLVRVGRAIFGERPGPGGPSPGFR